MTDFNYTKPIFYQQHRLCIVMRNQRSISVLPRFVINAIEICDDCIIFYNFQSFCIHSAMV